MTLFDLNRPLMKLIILFKKSYLSQTRDVPVFIIKQNKDIKPQLIYHDFKSSYQIFHFSFPKENDKTGKENYRPIALSQM